MVKLKNRPMFFSLVERERSLVIAPKTEKVSFTAMVICFGQFDRHFFA